MQDTGSKIQGAGYREHDKGSKIQGAIYREQDTVSRRYKAR